MKGAFSVEQPGAAGVRAGKLDGGLDAFASRTREVRLLQTSARERAEPPGQFACQFRNMALQHRRTLPLQFLLDRCDDGRVVVAGVVNTIAGEKIENAPAIGREKFGSVAMCVLNVHLQNVEQSHPLRIYAVPIECVKSLGSGCLRQICNLPYVVRVSPNSRMLE